MADSRQQLNQLHAIAIGQPEIDQQNVDINMSPTCDCVGETRKTNTLQVLRGLIQYALEATRDLRIILHQRNMDYAFPFANHPHLARRLVQGPCTRY